MKKIFTLAAIALFTLASCSDDDATSTDTTTGDNSVLLKKLIESDGNGTSITSTFTYDGNKIVKQEFEDGERDQYTYDGNNIIGMVNYSGTIANFAEDFEYDPNNKVIAYDYTDYDAEENNRHITFIHNSNNTISTKEYSIGEGSAYILEGNGVITLTNNNITKYVYTPLEGAVETTSYTFDDKNDATKNITGIDMYNIAVMNGGHNNILTVTGPDYTESNIYTYNSDNYPTANTYIDADGFTYTEQFIYE